MASSIDERAEVVRLYCDDECSLREVSRRTARSLNFIRAVLAAAGVPLRVVKGRPKKSEQPERDREIVRLYRAGRWTQSAIARKYGLSPERVREIIELRAAEFAPSMLALGADPE